MQPIGDKGIIIIGGDTIRGFTTSDQVQFLSFQNFRFMMRTKLFPRFNVLLLDLYMWNQRLLCYILFLIMFGVSTSILRLRV